MKKIYMLFTAVLFSCFIISCSKSDDSVSNKENPVLTGSIVGTWGIVSEKYKDGSSLSLNECRLNNDKIIFHSDGTTNEYYGKYENEKCTVETWSQNYSLSNGILTMKSKGSPQIELRYYVKELTSTTLALEYFYFREYPYEGNYMNESTLITNTYKKLK